MMQISHLDHLVLTVKDIEITCDFYHNVLGLKLIEFGDGRKALSLGNQKINLHQFGNEIKPHAKYPSPGSADLCFITEMPIGHIVEHLVDNQVKIIEGPIHRTGTNGPIVSVYFKDPDGNLIEIANQLTTSNQNHTHAA